MVDQAGARLILCATLVQHLPPRPVIYCEGGPKIHFTSEEQVPRREKYIFIKVKLSQYDATLRIPGYNLLAIRASELADNMIYQMFVANTVELLARKGNPHAPRW
jgi:hypothetical protein